MGDLRDQLKKANLLSKKDAKRLAHEDRVHRKKAGGAGAIDAEKQAHQEELRDRKTEQRERDRIAQAEVQKAKDAATERAACEALLAREVTKPSRKGAAAWYFALPDGRLPRLEVPLAERMQLAEGALCVVRVGPRESHDYGLMRTEHARRVARVFPGRIAWAAPGVLG